ncbi:uncharacterized protein LOC122499067 [Leptopilina heterotoma]|uniref:uncharacterized protein LOC122499067 n=1 Tax=Leptopilina heterotoma TaxID=63436 RepID=UPI001CA888AA|nr:uncharacterized protein LOC122499067 [Leptopilina heterotoma]
MRFAAVFLFLFAFYRDCTTRNAYDLYDLREAIHFCTENILNTGHHPFYNCREYEREYVGIDRITFGRTYCVMQLNSPTGPYYLCARNFEEANVTTDIAEEPIPPFIAEMDDVSR